MTGNRDTIVVGGSAGAFQVLRRSLQDLPGDLPASLFVVLHRAPSESRSYLRDLLQDVCSWPVAEPIEGEEIRLRRVYLAPTDSHMLIGEGHVHLRRGPRENNFRPALDPLFRSAGAFASTRTVGVVLSGYLDDGAAGLRAIRRCGGIGIVQDPIDAEAPDMPKAAQEVAEPEHVVPAADLMDLVARLCREACPPPPPIPPDIALELAIVSLDRASIEGEFSLGMLSPYNCPDCGGVLWEIKDGKLTRFRCHTGHAYTAANLLEAQARDLERRLFESLRAHRERARLLRQMAEREVVSRKDTWLRRAWDYERDAQHLETLLLKAQNDRPSLPAA